MMTDGMIGMPVDVSIAILVFYAQEMDSFTARKKEIIGNHRTKNYGGCSIVMTASETGE